MLGSSLEAFDDTVSTDFDAALASSPPPSPLADEPSSSDAATGAAAFFFLGHRAPRLPLASSPASLLADALLPLSSSLPAASSVLSALPAELELAGRLRFFAFATVTA